MRNVQDALDLDCISLLYLLLKALKLKHLLTYSMDFFPLVVEFIVDWQIQRSVEAFLARVGTRVPGPGLGRGTWVPGPGQGPRAPRMLRPIVEFVNQR